MTNYRRIFQNNSYIFITIVTFHRKKILIENIELLRESFKQAKNFYTFNIFAIAILEDHLHLIIKPENINEYPKIISSIKYYFSRKLNMTDFNLSKSNIIKREKGVWQRRYWEHTIRDEEDLYKHLDYIHYNPVKHDYVQNVRDWKYSSFDKFVKQELYEENWGCFDDIKHIKDFNIE